MKGLYGIRSCMPLLLFVIALSAEAHAESRRFRGNAYDLKTGQFLYSENHMETYRNGEPTGSVIYYRDSEEKVFAEKRSEYRPDSTAPSFQLQDYRSGYAEGCTPSAGTVKLFHKEGDKKMLQSEYVRNGSDLVVDSGFHIYLKKNWNSLLAGRSSVFRFGVPSRLKTFDFRVQKVGDLEIQGRRAVRFQLAPENILLRTLVTPILVDYDVKTKDLLAYTGLSNIYDDNGKAYNVYLLYQY